MVHILVMSETALMLHRLCRSPRKLVLMFKGRTLVIATKHAKEEVIAPILEEALGVLCVTTEDLDTDLLGTFTGEVERTLDPIETAREKCNRAMDAMGCDLAIASEGSFGPHPAVFFVAGDDEILVLVDRANELEIVAREVSTATNFSAEDVDTEEDLLAFAEKAQFPSHALILRKSAKSSQGIYKGITDRESLLDTFRGLQRRYGGAYVETDMRAMHNPSRMKVIADATHRLVELLKSECPQCGTPGFTVTDVIRGLPCELCALPTKAPQAHVSTCAKCGYSAQEDYPNGKRTENPMYCEFCNP